MAKKKILELYRMYEAAVQDAQQQIQILEQVYRENFGQQPQDLKEDFSGTSWISSEWVKRTESNTSLALDIDEEALSVGHTLHVESLSSGQQARLQLLRQNVLVPTARQVDVVAACNFSYFTFRKRADLLGYFGAAHASLKENGVFVLETAGGPGFEEAPFREKRNVKHLSGKKKGKKWFRYVWHQKSFDPMFRRGHYSIHFEVSDKKKYLDAFVYDWRIWTIPEVSDALNEAGFQEVQVYWEQDEPDENGVPVFQKKEVGDDSYDTWIVYIVGVKR